MRDLSARLEAAALSLTGTGPIKDRLCDASAHILRMSRQRICRRNAVPSSEP